MFTDNEPRGVFFLIDNKSFYASCEAIQRGYNPMKVPLVVLSEAENTGSGLILATSPEAKKLFHLKANVSRKRDLPQDPRLVVVPTRMNLYIQRNLAINEIFTHFTSEKEVFPYSIDESILDMTHSWRLFGETPRDVARVIQKTVRKQVGLYTTVGIGDNPIQAKLALDNYAKHNSDLIGEIHFETIDQKIWTLTNLPDVWSIGKKTAKKLNSLGIHSLYDLAHTNPYLIKEELGTIGLQLFALSWGVDRSKLDETIKPKAKSIGNSQVLPRDYYIQEDIETVIKEIGEQVCARLRYHQQLATGLSLGVGFSYSAVEENGTSGFSHAIKIDASNSDRYITSQLIFLFRKCWQGQSVRNISVYSSGLIPDEGRQLTLFEKPESEIKKDKLETVIDEIHKRFGFTKLTYARSLSSGGTAINRSQLVGGHNGGNSYE